MTHYSRSFSILKPLLILSLLTALTSQSSVTYMVNKLFDSICTQDQNQTISLYECQSLMVQQDKKTGNYRQGHDYAVQTFYMMEHYDEDKDTRLTRKEATNMAYDIVNGYVNERTIRIYWRDHGAQRRKEINQKQVKEKIDQKEEKIEKTEETAGQTLQGQFKEL